MVERRQSRESLSGGECGKWYTRYSLDRIVVAKVDEGAVSQVNWLVVDVDAGVN